MLGMLTKAFSARNLPEAFFTPCIVNARPFGSGSHQEFIQFTAMPREDGLYDVLKQRYSMLEYATTLVKEGQGLNKREAENLLRELHKAAMEDCRQQRSDRANPEHLPLRHQILRPSPEGVRWLSVGLYSQAMTTPPRPATEGFHLH